MQHRALNLRITLPPNRLLDDGDVDILLRDMHVLGEGGVGLPGSGVSGIGLLEHAVDLLQRQALHLRHEEISEGPADAAQPAPHEKDVRAQVRVAFAGADEVGCDGCDDLKGNLR